MAEAPEEALEVIQRVLDSQPEVDAISELVEVCKVPMAKEIWKNQWSVCSLVLVLEVLEDLVVLAVQVEHLAAVARKDPNAKAQDQGVLAALVVHQAVVHVDQGYDDVQVVFHLEVHRVMALMSVNLERILQRRVEQHPSCYESPEAVLSHQNQYRRGGQ